jgi:hypothetical protein
MDADNHFHNKWLFTDGTMIDVSGRVKKYNPIVWGAEFPQIFNELERANTELHVTTCTDFLSLPRKHFIELGDLQNKTSYGNWFHSGNPLFGSQIRPSDPSRLNSRHWRYERQDF